MHTFHIKTTLLPAIACLVMLMLLGPASAHAESTFDGLYQRPTHFPDFKPPTKWPSTMSYFVCARIDGKRLHNYEVAVYDQNGDMRATGRSIANQQELCTLTIPGDAGDTFHFKVVYGDINNPTIVDVPETCIFEANEYHGNIDDPYWLTLSGTTGIKSINNNRVKDEKLYMLSGIEVKEANKPGIYIKKGKKFIVR